MSRHEKRNTQIDAVSVADEYAELTVPDMQVHGAVEEPNSTSLPSQESSKQIGNAAIKNAILKIEQGTEELCESVDDLEAKLGEMESGVSKTEEPSDYPTLEELTAFFAEDSSVTDQPRIPANGTHVDSSSQSLTDVPEEGLLRPSPPQSKEPANSPERVLERLEQLACKLDDLSERLSRIERRLKTLETELKQAEPAFGDLLVQRHEAAEKQRVGNLDASASAGIESRSAENSWWRLNSDSQYERPLTTDSPHYSDWKSKRSRENADIIAAAEPHYWEYYGPRSMPMPMAEPQSDYSVLTIPSPQVEVRLPNQISPTSPDTQVARSQSNRPHIENPDEVWQFSEEIQEGIKRIATELDELRQDAVEIGGRLKSLASAIGSFFGEVADEVKERFASKPKPPIRTRAPSTWEADLLSFFDSRESVRLVDTDGNGFFEAAELRYALANNELRGADAAVVSQLLERYESLIQLSNDEWFEEDSGITVADLRAVHSNEHRGLRDDLSYWYRGLVQRWNDKPSTLFGTEDHITIDAFEQNGVGDCYLLAVAGSLATLRPQALREMFTTNPDGTIRVNIKGGFRGQFDVQMPQDGEILTYARVSKTHGIWPQVLERAVGRYRRQYENFGIFGTETHHAVDEGGSASDVIELLTGHKAKDTYLKNRSVADIENSLTTSLAEKRISVLSTGVSTDGREKVAGTNLLYNHVYSLVGYDRESKLFTVVDPNKNMSIRPESGDGYIRVTASQIKELFAWSYEETDEDIFWSVFSL